MRPAGWQIKHVTWFEDPLLCGFEVGDQLERRISNGLPVPWRGDSPPPFSFGLQQKDIVGVQMRADAAAITGHADHQIIDSCIRDESKSPEQAMRFVQMTIDAIDQHGPAGRA